MKNLESYIICHNQYSFDISAKKGFNHILVGAHTNMLPGMDKRKVIMPCLLKYNIEYLKSLLTFTAWYALAKNIKLSNYIGLFEYDCVFAEGFDNIDFKPNTIYGFKKHQLPDAMFLDCVPQFKNLLSEREIKNSESMLFWSPTTNFIFPKKFLLEFVHWYLEFILDILKFKNHPHFHERAVNVFAANNGYNIEYLEGVSHKQLCSHGINFNDSYEEPEQTCERCKKKMTLVRPGKYQCDNKNCFNNPSGF